MSRRQHPPQDGFKRSLQRYFASPWNLIRSNEPRASQCLRNLLRCHSPSGELDHINVPVCFACRCKAI